MADGHGKAGHALTFGSLIGSLHLPHRSISMTWYRRTFFILFSLCLVLSLTDLLSTSIALGMGLAEANGVIIALAQYTGWGIIGALTATKIVFLTGAGFACGLGLYTKVPQLRTRALILLFGLTLLLFVVAVNNIYWISVSL